jgi:hypothetical protein
MAVRVTFDKAKVMERVQKGLADGIADVALEVQLEIQETLSYPGRGMKGYLGRTDKGRKRWTQNPRSLPGDPPAKQTGDLRRSWQTAVRRSKIAGYLVTLRTGSILSYARALDRGTFVRQQAASPIDPNPKYARPYLNRSIALAEDAKPFVEIMNARLSKSLRKFSGMFKIRGVA